MDVCLIIFQVAVILVGLLPLGEVYLEMYVMSGSIENNGVRTLHIRELGSTPTS
jgi:hypothetical protein